MYGEHVENRFERWQGTELLEMLRQFTFNVL